MTPEQQEKLITVFDYGSITDEQKKAAEEIVSILETLGQHSVAELIRHKFNLVEIPKFDLEDSIFVQGCAKANPPVFVAIQGFIKEGEDDKAIQYPIVTISDDIRNLDKLALTIMSQVKIDN